MNNLFIQVQRDGFPGLIWMLHVESVDIEIKVIKSADMEHEATIHDNKSWMQFADWQIRQPFILLLVYVKAIAILAS